MAAAAPLQLEGILEGLQHVIHLAEHHQQQQPREIFARSVRVREAGGFLELLGLNIPGVGVAGDVANRLPLVRIDRASHILYVLKDLLLPEIRRQPTRAAYLLLLQACARGLRDDALAAGGSFNPMARDMAVRIEGFVGQAQNHPHFAPYGPLRAGVDDLLRGAERLLQATCTVRLDALVEAVADGAAGADQLGGAEEAAQEAAAAAEAALEEAAQDAEEAAAEE